MSPIALLVTIAAVVVSVLAWQPLTVDVYAHHTVFTPALCPTYESFEIEQDEHAVGALRVRSGVDLRVPRHYWMLRCENVTLQQTSAAPHPRRESRHDGNRIATPTLLAIDLAVGSLFERIWIDGAASVAVSWRWLQNETDVAIVADPLLQSVLAPSLGVRRLQNWLKKTTSYATLFVPAVPTRGEDQTPLDEWPSVDMYETHSLSRFVPAFLATLPTVEQQRLVLFLDRLLPETRSIAAYRNCTERVKHIEFLAALQDAVEERNFTFELFEHTTLPHDIATFRSAHTVIGPHGGAFANIVWMAPHSNVIEINHHERLSFAALSLEASLLYHRYAPRQWYGYHDTRPIEIDADDFIAYVGAVLDRTQPQRARCDQSRTNERMNE
jgi:hypothetical protein